jgi:hypothetical protein
MRSNGVRKLNFNQELPHSAVERPSPLRADLRRGARSSTADGIYDIQGSPQPEEVMAQFEHIEEEDEEEEEEENNNGYEESVAVLGTEYSHEELEEEDDRREQDTADDVILNGMDDEELIMDMPLDEAELEDAEEPISSPMVQKKKRALPKAKRRSVKEPSIVEDTSVVDPSLLEPAIQPRKRGRPRKSDTLAAAKSQAAKKQPAKKSKPAKAAPASKRAPKRTSTASALSNEDDSVIEQTVDNTLMPPPAFKPPPKRTQGQKRQATDDATTDGETSEAVPKKKAKKTLEKSSRRPQNEPAESSTQPNRLLAPAIKKPGQGTLALLRHTTPVEDLTILRSGRRSVRPIEPWKLEKINHTWDGTITEVIRVEEIQIKKPRKKRAGNLKSKKDLDIIEEEEDDLEEWEAEGETINGLLQKYNVATGQSSYDMHEEGEFKVIYVDQHVGY